MKMRHWLGCLVLAVCGAVPVSAVATPAWGIEDSGWDWLMVGWRPSGQDPWQYTPPVSGSEVLVNYGSPYSPIDFQDTAHHVVVLFERDRPDVISDLVIGPTKVTGLDAPPSITMLSGLAMTDYLPYLGGRAGTNTHFIPEPTVATDFAFALGFSEGNVQVFVLSAVPEPELYAMLLAGLGLVGFMARRRKA